MNQQPQLMDITWNEERLKRDRLARLRAEMRSRNVGALLLTSWVSGRYALNVRVPSGEAFVPVEGDPIYFVRPMDAGYVELANIKTDKYIYEHNPSDPEGEKKAKRWADSVADLMAQYGVAEQALGVDTMEPEGTLALANRGLKLMNARTVLQRAAAIKTQDEVLIYWEMGKLYDRIMSKFRDDIAPGISEREMISRVYSNVVSMGGEGLLQINVCAGEDTWPWRRWPTNKRFEDGDLVGMDLHVYGPGGYIYDSSRTYLCGSKANAKQKELYRIAHDYNNACIELLKPGMAIPEWVERLPQVSDKHREAAYTFHIIHSTGLTPGEYPNVVKQRKPVEDTFKENQVLVLDCYFGEEGYDQAVKLEEQVVITKTGAVKMANMPYDERLLAA